MWWKGILTFEVFSSDQKTNKTSRLPLCYPVSQTLNWCSCATLKIVILVQSWLKEKKLEQIQEVSQRKTDLVEVSNKTENVFFIQFVTHLYVEAVTQRIFIV